MPTPSELAQGTQPPPESGEWTARTDTPKRSVFGNYRATGAAGNTELPQPGVAIPPAPASAQQPDSLQSAISLGVARSFLHRLLATAFADPSREAWDWLNSASTAASLECALATQDARLATYAAAWIAALNPNAFEPFLDAHAAAFGHAARGACPLNEIEYGDIKADPLFQPHRLADLAAFYHAFGLDVVDSGGERQDHLCLELEFMCVLAAKEAYALEYQLDDDELSLCRDAQRKFLSEHLGRWTPAFARRLAATTNNPTLHALAGFLRTFVECECARFHVRPGSEDLHLRPVDESADRMCDSCGLSNVPPGAVPDPDATLSPV